MMMQGELGSCIPPCASCCPPILHMRVCCGAGVPHGCYTKTASSATSALRYVTRHVIMMPWHAWCAAAPASAGPQPPAPLAGAWHVHAAIRRSCASQAVSLVEVRQQRGALPARTCRDGVGPALGNSSLDAHHALRQQAGAGQAGAHSRGNRMMCVHVHAGGYSRGVDGHGRRIEAPTTACRC